jgi:molybdopterin converting factor subunit 1
VSEGARLAVSVRLFAILRERAGTDRVEIELEQGATVADALGVLACQPGLEGVLDRLPVQMAVNREYARAETVLGAGDELALIPPVSGGGEPGVRVHALVTGERLSIERLSAAVSNSGAGAVVVFEGVTREVPALDYEAYSEMAVERIESILRECVQAHGLLGAAAEHRTGNVPLGEPSVIVAVSAAHRGEAFEGARMAIDLIKEQTPIWKREDRGEGRQEWVRGTPPPVRERT